MKPVCNCLPDARSMHVSTCDLRVPLFDGRLLRVSFARRTCAPWHDDAGLGAASSVERSRTAIDGPGKADQGGTNVTHTAHVLFVCCFFLGGLEGSSSESRCLLISQRWDASWRHANLQQSEDNEDLLGAELTAEVRRRVGGPMALDESRVMTELNIYV